MGETAQEFLLVHAIFESLAAFDEDDGNLVGELAAQLLVGIHVDLVPGEAAAALQLGQRLLDDFTEVAALARVENDLAGLRHGGSVTELDGGRQTGRSVHHRSDAGTMPTMTADQKRPLAGKAVLITGGARRLGRATALAMAEAGADVAITFLHSAREAQHTVIDACGFGGRAVALRCDITQEKSVRSAIRETARELGGIDILVNNAANYETVEFEKLSVKQWDAIFASNTRGPFLVSREALKPLRERRGKIINMGSLGGLQPWPTHAHYCSSKAALHMLTKVMAKALAPEIAVNCVAPGMIDLGEKAAAGFMKKMARQTPMRRNGSDRDITSAILFFATAPHFITGQILAVDGGLGL